MLWESWLVCQGLACDLGVGKEVFEVHVELRHWHAFSRLLGSIECDWVVGILVPIAPGEVASWAAQRLRL